MKSPNMEHAWAMPNGRTFTIPPIKAFVERFLHGSIIVDPFANECTYGTLTNDLNSEFNTTCHMDALTFLSMLQPSTVDTVLYDPPYSITQAAQLYRSYGKDKLEVSVANMKYWKLCKDAIAACLKQGGVCLSFGWNSNGLGKNRGFEMTDILLVAHGGSKNDTICCREVKL